VWCSSIADSSTCLIEPTAISRWNSRFFFENVRLNNVSISRTNNFFSSAGVDSKRIWTQFSLPHLKLTVVFKLQLKSHSLNIVSTIVLHSCAVFLLKLAYAKYFIIIIIIIKLHSSAVSVCRRGFLSLKPLMEDRADKSTPMLNKNFLIY